MSRGICQEEYVEGNILVCFAIVISYSFSPAPPLLQSQLPPSFLTVNKNQVLCIPLKRTKRQREKIGHL